MTKTNLSFLEIVGSCDNFDINRAHLSDDERLVPFHLTPLASSPVVGLLRPAIVEQLKVENGRDVQPDIWNIDSIHHFISFGISIDSHSKRTAAMKDLCERWRDTGLFEDVCGPSKWRDEMYPVYADPFGVHDYPSRGTEDTSLNYVFEMERSACALFGIVTYGVHMSIYEEETSINGQKSIRVWVPTRASTKQTWPGYLDNSVAGGVPAGMPILESMIKECMEEASLEDGIVRKYIQPTGAVSYFFRTAAGWLQPEIEYVFDIRIPIGSDANAFVPKPLDGEVESFELLPFEEIITKMRAGLFKANCALVLLDLFIRLGYITPDNEADFMKIITRLHGTFGYNKWAEVGKPKGI